MGKTSNGLKAGVLAGIVYGIISVVFTLIALTMFKTEVIAALTQFMSTRPVYSEHGITAQMLYNDFRISGTAVPFIFGIILGLILGYVYAHVKSRLPGSRGVAGGILIGLIMWVIIGLALGSAYAREFGTSYFGVYAAGSLVASLVFGYLLSVIYARYESSTSMINEPAKSSP